MGWRCVLVPDIKVDILFSTHCCRQQHFVAHFETPKAYLNLLNKYTYNKGNTNIFTFILHITMEIMLFLCTKREMVRCNFFNLQLKMIFHNTFGSNLVEMSRHQRTIHLMSSSKTLLLWLYPDALVFKTHVIFNALKTITSGFTAFRISLKRETVLRPSGVMSD